MENYLDSNKVSVFPASHRNNYISDARLLSEKNLVRLINQFTDTKSFIISENFVDGRTYEFNIEGYYFRLLNFYASSAIGSGNYIYAEIVVENDELVCTDVDNKFTGLSVYRSEYFLPYEDGNIRRFLILSRDSSTSDWSIPDESKLKFHARSIGIDVLAIDGGKI